MTIHVTIPEAERRLAELVSAAAAGEEVILDRGEGSQAKIVYTPPRDPAEIERIAAKRRAAIGMFSDLIGNRQIDVTALRAEDRWDEHYRIMFADID